jgi:DNA-binding NarL/FixJ family response regulator
VIRVLAADDHALARGGPSAMLATDPEFEIVTERELETHFTRVASKLDLRDRVQAVVFCCENGLVEAGAPGD